MIVCLYLFGMVITWTCYLYTSVYDENTNGWMNMRKIVLWPIIAGKLVFQFLYKTFIDEKYEIN